MIIDPFGVRAAWRTATGVGLESRRPFEIKPDPIAAPSGHHIVACALESPYGHVTSDGRTLWIWQRDTFGPRASDPPPVDLMVAAQEVLNQSWRDHARQIIPQLASEPMGPLRHAMFSLAYDENFRYSQTPRWPTLIFGCGDRLVVSQLDFFGNTLTYRALEVSPTGEERRMIALPTDLQGVSIFELNDGSTAIGNAYAEMVGFDDCVYSAQTRLDCEPSTHGAFVVEVETNRWIFGTAGDREIVLGRLGLLGEVRVTARFPRRPDEWLIGVTHRDEALVRVGSRILARTPDTDHVIVAAEHPIEEAVAMCNYGLYREAGAGLSKPVAFLY